jgi:hypothetical protein
MQSTWVLPRKPGAKREPSPSISKSSTMPHRGAALIGAFAADRANRIGVNVVLHSGNIDLQPALMPSAPPGRTTENGCLRRKTNRNDSLCPMTFRQSVITGRNNRGKLEQFSRRILLSMSAWKISIRFAIKDIATVVSLSLRSSTHRLGYALRWSE